MPNLFSYSLSPYIRKGIHEWFDGFIFLLLNCFTVCLTSHETPRFNIIILKMSYNFISWSKQYIELWNISLGGEVIFLQCCRCFFLKVSFQTIPHTLNFSFSKKSLKFYRNDQLLTQLCWTISVLHSMYLSRGQNCEFLFSWSEPLGMSPHCVQML